MWNFCHLVLVGREDQPGRVSVARALEDEVVVVGCQNGGYKP